MSRVRYTGRYGACRLALRVRLTQAVTRLSYPLPILRGGVLHPPCRVAAARHGVCCISPPLRCSHPTNHPPTAPSSAAAVAGGLGSGASAPMPRPSPLRPGRRYLLFRRSPVGLPASAPGLPPRCLGDGRPPRCPPYPPHVRRSSTRPGHLGAGPISRTLAEPLPVAYTSSAT